MYFAIASWEKYSLWLEIIQFVEYTVYTKHLNQYRGTNQFTNENSISFSLMYVC